MKRKIYFLFFLLFWPASAYPETLTIDFADLPRLLEGSQNGNVLSSKSNLSAAKVQEGHLKRSFLPRIKAELGVEIFQAGSFELVTEPTQKVEAQANLYRGGKDKLEEQIKQSQSTLASTEVKKRFSQELFKARSYYIDLLYYRELVQHLKGASILNRDNKALLQRQIVSGLATQTNQLEFEIENNQLKQDLLLLEEDYEHTLDQLKVTLGLSTEINFKIQESFAAQQDNELLSREASDESQFEVSALKTQESILQKQEQQTKRWWLPSLDAYTSYGLYSFKDRSYLALGNQDEAVGGVKLSMDLFDGFQAMTQRKVLQHQAQAYRYESSQKTKELEILFKKLKHELKTYYQMLLLEQKILAQSQNYYKLSLAEHDRGLKDSLDLLNMRQKLLERQKNYTELKRKYWMVKSHLLGMLGE